MTLKDSLEKVLQNIINQVQGCEEDLEYEKRLVQDSLASILALIEKELPKEEKPQAFASSSGGVYTNTEYCDGWNDCISEMRKKLEVK